MIILPILTMSLIHFSLKAWENLLLELGSERVKCAREYRHGLYLLFACVFRGSLRWRASSARDYLLLKSRFRLVQRLSEHALQVTHIAMFNSEN